MNKTLDDTTIKHLVDTYIQSTLESLDHYINSQQAVSRYTAQGQLETLMMIQTEHEKPFQAIL